MLNFEDRCKIHVVLENRITFVKLSRAQLLRNSSFIFKLIIFSVTH